ncbi:preprotein translocase subunit SecG [Candidatus Dependentiae bacterium]|nr:preprotein translocase subunit SecG [Candidatus Dependentiae bacterium]
MLIEFLTVLFVIAAFFLALFVLIQQGKGDMGMGALSGSTQMLFGGSGGQTFFEKATWVLGLIFMFGALGLSVLKSRQIRKSRLDSFTTAPQAPTNTKATQQESAPTKDVATESTQAPAA